MKRLAALLAILLLFGALVPTAGGAGSADLVLTCIDRLIYVSAGDTFTVRVRVENATGDEARDIVLSLSSPPGVSTVPRGIGTLADGASAEVTLSGNVSAAATASHYLLNLTAEYKDSGSNIRTAGSLDDVMIAVIRPEPAPPSAGRPYLQVTGASFTPATPDLSRPFKVSFDFRNSGEAEARNVVVTLDGLDNFEVTSLTNRVVLDTAWAGSRYTAAFDIRAKQGRTANTVKLEFKYFHENQEVQAETVNLPLGDVAKPGPGERPLLKVVSFKAEPEKPEGNFILTFQLRNLGSARAENVLVRLDSTQAFPRDRSNVLFLPSLAAGGTTELSLKMQVVSTDARTFNLPITLNCSDSTGESYTGQENITIPAGSIGLTDGGGTTISGTPRVMLGKYTLSQNQVLAGDTVRLILNIENNSRVEVGNAKISLGVIQMTGESGGTVFSPVNSSNSFFVEKIGARQTHVREIDLYVDPNAAARTYIVPVEIVYEDRDGNQYKVDELVNIPVIQESRLQVLSVEVPPVGAPGQPVPVTAEFVNVGKVALKNFLISIEGDFPKENATYFLANMEIGASDYFMGMIIPREEGLLAGTVVFTYTDNTNREVRIEKPFEVNIQQMDFGKEPEFPHPVFPPDQGGSSLAGRLLGSMKWLGPLVLVLVAAIILIVKRVRAKRGEMFSEDF